MYKVYFKYFGEEHELRIGEQLRGKLNFVLAYLSYSEQSVEKHDHAEDDAFRSNGMGDMVKVLGDVMELRAHGYMFCSNIQIAYWYNGIGSSNKRRAIHYQEESCRTRSGSEEGEGIEQLLRPAFERKNSALYYTCAADICKKQP